MIEKISSIRQALECGCYIPALALALTLPDICGQIEYPGMVDNKGHRLVGKQYETWFDDWVNHWYADHTGFIDEGRKANSPYFNGKMCYDLRCSLLHSGNSDINDFGEEEDEANRYSYYFELCINGSDSYGTMWEYPQLSIDKTLKLKTVRIDTGSLCRNLCSSAERYYQHKGSECFFEHKIELIDIKKSLSLL